MKLKIKKDDFFKISSFFEKENCAEITLEPVIDTATQAIYEQELKNRAFEMGVERGYREGFYDGRCPERRNKYQCSHCF